MPIKEPANMPPIRDQWSGGLNESVLSTLALIAEGKPDVFSIVKRAWSQGNDADTIKQMLKSLKYPTKDVDRIVSKLEARKAGTQQPQDRQQGKPQEQPKDQQSTQQPVPVVKTGNDYIDALVNRKLKSGGKEAAISFATGMLAKYEQDVQSYLANIRSMISSLDLQDLRRLMQALDQNNVTEDTSTDTVPKLVMAIRNLPPSLRNQILSDVRAAAGAAGRRDIPSDRDRLGRTADPTRRAVSRLQSIDSLLRGKRKS